MGEGGETKNSFRGETLMDKWSFSDERMKEDTAIKEQGELRHKVRKTQGVDGKASVDSEHLRVRRELI